MIISNTCVVTLRQLLKWQTKLLQTQKEALKMATYKDALKGCYLHNAEVVQHQLDLLNRLIEQAKLANNAE